MVSCDRYQSTDLMENVHEKRETHVKDCILMGNIGSNMFLSMIVNLEG